METDLNVIDLNNSVRLNINKNYYSTHESGT
jgi:hypothetical protein